MLILPLHKPLSLETFPWATMLLLIVNAYVFFVLQSADRGPIAAAQTYYLASGLGEHELPAYRHYLREKGDGQALGELDGVPERSRVAYMSKITLYDSDFARRLSNAEGIEDPAAWRPLREHYQLLLDEIFTLRHVQRNSEWSPRRMLASSFLHGGLAHLIGNMLFLVALGLLLEGAVGPMRLLVVYLLGALGASAFSVLWRWGEPGAGMGASGAIAALMGAFCVVWGRRKVRFFYWLGVIFDYVRAPAIWLLPVWLGWEVYNLLFNGDRGIGFDAHAGGLVCGALMGAVLVVLRQTRPGYMLDNYAAVAVDERWQRAQQCMGQMRNLEAERLLAELDAERPRQFEIVLARCRVARNSANYSALYQRGLELLELPACSLAQVLVQQELVHELQADGIFLPVNVRNSLLSNWCALGRLAEAEELLDQAADEQLSREEVAQSWLGLAQQHAVQGTAEQRERILRMLVRCYPDLPQATKARFLLENI